MAHQVFDKTIPARYFLSEYKLKVAWSNQA